MLMLISPAKKLNAGKKYKDIKTEIRFQIKQRPWLTYLRNIKHRSFLH
jgi:hypothetical protein